MWKRTHKKSVDIYSMLPEVGLHKSVQKLWQRDLFSDFTIEVEEEAFKVHKVIMASVSDYFLAMLTGDMLESKTDRVKLHGLNSLAVSNILEYIYTNEITGTKASAADILGCAVYLQIPSAVKAAEKILSNEIDKTNCFDILSTFMTYSLKDSAKETEEYIKRNFNKITKILNLQDMSHDSLLMLIKMWEGSEWDLFLIIKDWVEVDSETRKQHLNELMIKLRFTLMTPEQVGKIQEMEIYSLYKWSWCDHVEQALIYHSAPLQVRVIDDSLPPADVRAERSPALFSAVTKDEQLIHRVKTDGRNLWDVVFVSDTPDFTDGVAAVIELNVEDRKCRNYLVVCGHYSGGTQAWYIFNPRTLIWSPMPGMSEPRADFAIVECTPYLYVLGGTIGLGTGSESVTGSIEKFNFFDNTWSTLERKLPIPLYEPMACHAHGNLYVTGGWETIDDYSTRMDSFEMNSEEGSWQSRAHLLVAMPSAVMHVLRRQDIIVLVNEEFLMQCYDIKADQWSMWDCKGHVDYNLMWCEYSTILADEGNDSLYFLNLQRDRTYYGSDREDDDDDDSYSHESGCCVKWEICVKEREIQKTHLPDFYISKHNDKSNVDNAICACLAIQPSPKWKDTVTVDHTDYSISLPSFSFSP